MKITIDYDPSAEHGLERVEWERADDGKWQPFWTTMGHRHEQGIEEPQQVLWEIALICRLLGEGDALLADLDPGIPA
jgi:hypothetical protein